MKLKSLRIQNFRSFEDETIEFGDYTSFVGPNGSGKSTVFNALNVFFRDTQTPGVDTALAEDDFHDKNTAAPVELTLTFTHLGDEAREDFGHYCRHGQLIVSAVAAYDPGTRSAPVQQRGQRVVMEAFTGFFEAHKQPSTKVKVGDLIVIYQELQKQYRELPDISTRDGMRDALRVYEESHPGSCAVVPSDDQFYGASKGENRLQKHVQWVCVPAVKEFSAEDREAKGTFLGRLLARTVRQKISFDADIDKIRQSAQSQYDDLLRQSEQALDETSEALCKRIAAWAHPEAKLRLEWEHEGSNAVQIGPPFAKTIAGEGEFEGQLTRFGHGFQRAYLLALLEELASCDTENAPTLLLACEEPELYQHPPQARHLYDVLTRLSSGNGQVMVCTHSPYFVAGNRFEDIRVVRKTNGHATVSHATLAKVTESLGAVDKKQDIGLQGSLARIHQALQPGIREMFFAPRLILVEGLEDVAYIVTYLQLLDLWEEYRRLGCHMVPVNGKSEMARPLVIAQQLSIPTLAVLDADGDEEREVRRAQHQKENAVVMRLCGIEAPDPFPSEPLFGEHCVVWPLNIEKTVESDVGQTTWAGFLEEARIDFNHAPGLSKNTLFIARTLEIMWHAHKRSDAMQRLCDKVIEFGRRAD